VACFFVILVSSSYQWGRDFPHGLPGWEAFRAAACPVWPYEGYSIGGWYGSFYDQRINYLPVHRWFRLDSILRLA
jgi:hypothetical protein